MQEKVKAVQEWSAPMNAKEVRQCLGLSSYYCQYTHQFAKIAKPLNVLTQKSTPFIWSNKCEASFNTLQQKLMEAPILAYPSFHRNDSPFILQMDASAVGLGAVLEQDGQVIAYASTIVSRC